MQAAFDRELSRLLDGYNGPLLLAVSGGVDSMAMLFLAQHSALRPSIAVAHVNFSLRPGACDKDEALVREYCTAAGIPFFTKKFDTTSFASKKGISIEMAARELRYGWFSTLMEEHGYGRLLVAHNRNDSAETMMLNMLRGTGLRGLCGIREISGAVLRPMLGFSRRQIEEYAKANGIAWREDASNAEVDIARNRLRHNVFPEFEKINPSFLNTFCEEAGRFAQAQAILDELFEDKRSALCSRDGDAECILIEALKAEPHREYWMFRLLEPYGFSSAQIASALEAVDAQSGKEFTSATHRLIRDRECFKIYPLATAGDYTIMVDTFPRPAAFDPKSAPAGVLYADADTLPEQLQCRPWQQGDRFRPLGMQGSRLVSDFFTDLKLDLEQKKRARIVYWDDAAGEHIAAVAPYRIDDRHKITTSTRRIAVISLKQNA